MKLRIAPTVPAVTALLLSGCALVPERAASARTEPLPEEVARRLETVRGERTDYPSFREIPQTPADLRTPAQWAEAVGSVKAEGRALTQWAANNPPEVADVDAYAAQARRELGVGPDDVPPPDQAARIEALARQMRARATPPAPIPY